jgi:hypothetical protein
VIRDLIRHPALYLQAAIAVACAARRVRKLEPQLAFDELVQRLRSEAGWTARLATPQAQARAANRLLPHLGPRDMGICLKRSLVLVHLWSAHGLSPRLHLGLRLRDGAEPDGHAWLSVDDAAVAGHTGSQGDCKETLVL